MELQSLDETFTIHAVEQSTNGTFDFVSDILGTVFAGQNEEIHMYSQNFLCNQNTGVEATGPLRVAFDYDKFIQKEWNIEITISGKLVKEKGRKETFNLYYFIQLDSWLEFLLQDRHRGDSGTCSLTVPIKKTSKQLSDSVFELTLYRLNGNGQRELLGHGRGYVVFGRRR